MDDDLLQFDYAPYLPDLPINKVVCVVARPVCIDVLQDVHCLMTIPFGTPFRFQGQLADNMVSYSLMRVRIASPGKTPLLVQENDSMVWGHPQCTWDDVLQVTELCAGMGGMSQGAKAANFVPVVACELRPRMADLYQKHCGAKVVVGDITKLSVLQSIYNSHPRTTTMAAGISCQPYSVLGDGKSGDDPRAQTLPATLAAAHFLRSMAIILECVEPAGSDAFVRWHVDQFCIRTGFHKSEQILHLNEVWPCKRSRWWCILTAPLVGQVDLRPFPTCNDLKVVRDVLPQIHRWSDHDENSLQLKAVELEAFMDSNGTCTPYLLNFSGIMPCALHAWGSQLLPCPCGCRQTGLSADRIKARGLYGVLARSMPSENSLAGKQQRFRHLHPQEAGLMCGMDPCLEWGDDPRLALSGVGQIASPLQAMWVFQHLLRQLHFVKLGEWSVKPHAALLTYRSWLLARARFQWNFGVDMFSQSEALHMSLCWQPQIHDDIDLLLEGPIAMVDKFSLLQKSCTESRTEQPDRCQPAVQTRDLTLTQVAIPSPGEVSDCEVDRLAITLHVKFGNDASGENLTQLFVKPGSTVQQLIDAETAFQGFTGKVCIQTLAGDFVEPGSSITHQQHLVMHVESQTPTHVVTPRDECEVNIANPLLKVKSHGFLNLQGPRVTTIEQSSSLRAQTILGSDRAIVLENQGLVWGDDELVWHLSQIQIDWSAHGLLGDAMPHIIDPLLTHGWMLVDATSCIQAWFQSCDMPTFFITAVLHKSHWIPFIGQFRSDRFEVSYLRTSSADEQCIQHFVSMITSVFPQVQAVVVPVDFIAVTPSCGAHAIAFIRHLVLGGPLPTTPHEVAQQHHKLRKDFVAAVQKAWVTYHPWIWGAGGDMQEKAVALLKPILKEQGVNPDHLQSRTLQAIKSCGAEDVMHATARLHGGT